MVCGIPFLHAPFQFNNLQRTERPKPLTWPTRTREDQPFILPSSSHTTLLLTFQPHSPPFISWNIAFLLCLCCPQCLKQLTTHPFICLLKSYSSLVSKLLREDSPCRPWPGQFYVLIAQCDLPIFIPITIMIVHTSVSPFA